MGRPSSPRPLSVRSRSVCQAPEDKEHDEQEEVEEVEEQEEQE